MKSLWPGMNLITPVIDRWCSDWGVLRGLDGGFERGRWVVLRGLGGFEGGWMGGLERGWMGGFEGG